MSNNIWNLRCFCPYCIEGWGFSPRRAYCLSLEVSGGDSPLRCNRMGLGPRPTAREDGYPIPPEAFLDVFATNYPTVLALLTTTRWDTGELRHTTTLNLFYEEGSCKVWANDRDQERSCCFSGRSFSECLAALEEAVKSGRADWRRPKRKNQR